MKLGEQVRIAHGERKGQQGEVITLPHGEGKYVTILLDDSGVFQEGCAVAVEMQDVELVEVAL